tara:strand:- start:445 stop:789 length:345 start_codon:yes stop_codon:yes gene_type:complete
MAVNSKRKGKVNEQAWANILKGAGFKDARRGQQHRGSPESPDVICSELAWFHFEVKSGKQINIWRALEQAERDKGQEELSVVAAHKDRERWVVSMYADEWLEVVKSMGCLSPHG